MTTPGGYPRMVRVRLPMPRMDEVRRSARADGWQSLVRLWSGRQAMWVRRWAARGDFLSVAAFLAVVLCLYFWPLLGGDQLGESHILYDVAPWHAQKPPGLSVIDRYGERDAALEYQPLLQVARDQVRAGNLPLWNPYSSGGMPLLGDMQEALLYPLTWLAFLLPLNGAWGLIALLKLLTAGLGAYALGRGLRIGVVGSLVAALVYMLSAPLIVPVQWPHGTVLFVVPVAAPGYRSRVSKTDR